jgi:hypothetical protein
LNFDVSVIIHESGTLRVGSCALTGSAVVIKGVEIQAGLANIGADAGFTTKKAVPTLIFVDIETANGVTKDQLIVIFLSKEG